MSGGLSHGWSYEGPDESVGLFGEAFMHDDCPLPENSWDPAVASYGTDGITVICKCGASFEIAQPEPEPYWED